MLREGINKKNTMCSQQFSILCIAVLPQTTTLEAPPGVYQHPPSYKSINRNSQKENEITQKEQALRKYQLQITQ